MTRAACLLACAGAMCCAGCTYYVPATTVPVTQTVTQPANFDRSFNAALGAMQDQGLAIQRSDASGGVIVGMRDNSTVTANLSRQADGSVRVAFSAADARDPDLIDRITRSYNARMGR